MGCQQHAWPAHAPEQVEAEVNYIRDNGQRPVAYTYPAPAGTPQRSALLQPTRVAIRNARLLAQPASLEREGFQLVREASAVGDFEDEAQVRERYYPESIALLRRLTGAAEAVGLVLPELAGKLTGLAVRVPVINVSLVDLTVQVARDTSVDEVNRLLREASEGSPVLGYNTQPLVSVDFNHDPRSSIFDANHTKVSGRLVKAMAWYDNEWGFSNRMLDSALALALRVEEGLRHTAIMHSQNVSRLNLAARTLQTSIFVKNGPSYAGIGVGGEGFTTFTIATPTGEGTTSARTFARLRRCVLANGFSIR